MSKKTQTDSKSDSTLKFDPASKGIYDLLTKAGSGQLLQQIQNPFGNPAYQLGLGQSQKAAGQAGQNLMKTLQQNQKVSGLFGNGGNAFQMAQQGKIGRTTAGLQSNANIQNIMNAFARQQGSIAQAMSFNPLMTGEKSNSQQTQTTSGVGSWLPQVAGMAMQAGLGMATGGASMAFPGMSPGAISASFGGPGQAATNMSTNSFIPGLLQ
jgi:hypothetical protein